MTTVASFDSVGAILVVALLVAPPATAYLLTDKFKYMIAITCVIAVIISFFGYYLAVYLDGSIAGAIVTVAGILFILAFLFSPSNGIVLKRLVQKREAAKLSQQQASAIPE
jgi:manganese/zinc/iron transport system permease protein